MYRVRGSLDTQILKENMKISSVLGDPSITSFIMFTFLIKRHLLEVRKKITLYFFFYNG